MSDIIQVEFRKLGYRDENLVQIDQNVVLW